MAEGYGAQGMVGRLRRVLMRRPGEAMTAADPAAWHYTGAIDVEQARRAHDAFADALRAWDVEVLYHEEPLPDHSDSVFVFDPALVTDLNARVAELERTNADLKAQASRMARKTMSPLVTAILAKNEVGDSTDSAVLDKALASLSVEQRMAVKAEMARAGMIE